MKEAINNIKTVIEIILFGSIILLLVSFI